MTAELEAAYAVSGRCPHAEGDLVTEEELRCLLHEATKANCLVQDGHTLLQELIDHHLVTPRVQQEEDGSTAFQISHTGT